MSTRNCLRVRRPHKCRLSTSATHFHQRSEEHTSELQSLRHLVCRLLLEKKKKSDDGHLLFSSCKLQDLASDLTGLVTRESDDVQAFVQHSLVPDCIAILGEQSCAICRR